MSQQQQQQALQQLDQAQVAQINQELNNGRIRPEQIAKARKIIVTLLGAGLAIEAINNVFPGALGLFLINTVNTAWHMSSTGAIVLARAAGSQIVDTSALAVKTLLGLVTASMGLACNTYSALKEYVTMSNVNYMLSFIVGRAVLQGTADIERYARDFLQGEMDGVISDQIARVREGLISMGSTAAQWTSGFQEAMASMGQRTVEGVIDRQMYLTEVNQSLSDALYDALQEHIEESETRSSVGEAITNLWQLREDDPEQFESLSPKLKFLFSMLHGIERVSNQQRNALGSYSVPGSQEERMLQSVEPSFRADERMAPLYASVPSEVERRYPGYGTKIRAPRCPPTEAQIEEAIEAVTDMVSGRQFNPDNSEAYDLITKNGFLRVIMMEPVNPRRSGNIFTAFTRLPVAVQENIIRGMYNDLPQDVDIERALTRENINAWADRFRREIMLSSDTSRRSVSARARSSDSDEENISKINKSRESASSRMKPRPISVSAANAPYPSDSNEDTDEGKEGGRRRRRRMVTRKCQKSRRQTKRKNGQKCMKGRKKQRQTKRR